MNRNIAQLFIKWIWQVASMLVYQSHIFSKEQLQELVKKTDELEKALEQVMK